MKKHKTPKLVRLEGSYRVSPGIYNWLLSVDNRVVAFKGSKAELDAKMLELAGVA